MISVGSQDQVITTVTAGEIFLFIIDDMIGPDRAYHLQVPRAAHSGNFRPERFGDLHGKGPHATRCTLDQYFLARIYVPLIAQSLQGGESSQGYRGSLLERKISWFQRDFIFHGADILSKRAPAIPG